MPCAIGRYGFISTLSGPFILSPVCCHAWNEEAWSARHLPIHVYFSSSLNLLLSPTGSPLTYTPRGGSARQLVSFGQLPI